MAESNALPPRHPGEILRERVDAIGITQDKLAEALDVSRFTVNQLLNGRRGISAEMALRLAHVLGTSAEVWLNLQAKVDLFEAQRKFGEKIGSLHRLRELESLY